MYKKLRKLFRSSSAYVLGSLVNRSLFIISMPIMTRYLAPKEYGTLTLVNTVIVIMTTFCGLGIHDFVMRYYYEQFSEIDCKRFLGAILTFFLSATLIFSIVLSIFGNFIFPKLFKDIQFSPYMLLGIWICFAGMLGVIPDALFRIKNEVALFLKITLSRSVLLITLSIISVVIFRRGAEGPLAASLIVGIVFGFYFLIYLKKKIELNFSSSIIKKCLSFGLPVGFHLMGRVFLEAADRLLLQWFVGLSVVAYYSVGIVMGSILVLISTSIDASWAPFYYATAKKENEYNAKELFSYASIYLASLILFLGLCPMIFRHEIIYILAPPSYYQVIPIIPFIMIAAILNSLFFIPVRGLYQQEKTIYLPVIILTGLILNIILNIVLIPKFNMFGAALATIAASFVMLTLCFIASQKVYYIPYQYIRFLKVLFTCVLCYSLSLFIHDQPLFLSIFLKTLIILVFPLGLYLLRFFEPREIHKIKQSTIKLLSWLKPLMNGLLPSK